MTYDNFLDRQANAARDEAQQHVDSFNARDFYNPNWDTAHVETDGPHAGDFSIAVYDGEFGHIRVKHFTGHTALVQFQEWIDLREMEAIGEAA